MIIIIIYTALSLALTQTWEVTEVTGVTVGKCAIYLAQLSEIKNFYCNFAL